MSCALTSSLTSSLCSDARCAAPKERWRHRSAGAGSQSFIPARWRYYSNTTVLPLHAVLSLTAAVCHTICCSLTYYSLTRLGCCTAGCAAVDDDDAGSRYSDDFEPDLAADEHAEAEVAESAPPSAPPEDPVRSLLLTWPAPPHACQLAI